VASFAQGLAGCHLVLLGGRSLNMSLLHVYPQVLGDPVCWLIPGNSGRESKILRETGAWHRCELEVEGERVVTRKFWQESQVISLRRAPFFFSAASSSLY
jgi:hypothetical protein